jgi:hypothetical protein
MYKDTKGTREMEKGVGDEDTREISRSISAGILH